MSETWDVVILGGGPGGSSLASCLAKRGRRALVLEKERFPRFHIGESLLPRSREDFDFAYQVPRAEFDDLLLRHAEKLGAVVRERWEAIEVIFEGSRAVGVRAR